MALDETQFESLIDMQIQGIFEQLGGAEVFDEQSLRWLEGKQRHFSGDDYLNELEKGAVFFAEATGSLQRAATRYLHAGEPSLEADKITAFVQHVERKVPLNTVYRPVLAYVRAQQADAPQQYSTWDWGRLRARRLFGVDAAYTRDLEMICRNFQTTTTVANMYLTMVLNTPELAGACAGMPVRWVFEVVANKIQTWTNYSIGAMVLALDGMDLSNPPLPERDPEQNPDDSPTRSRPIMLPKPPNWLRRGKSG